MDVAIDDPEPTAPERPLPTDCCGSGCPRCVNDVYAEALDRYELELAAWRKRQIFGSSNS